MGNMFQDTITYNWDKTRYVFSPLISFSSNQTNNLTTYVFSYSTLFLLILSSCRGGDVNHVINQTLSHESNIAHQRHIPHKYFEQGLDLIVLQRPLEWLILGGSKPVES